MQGKLHPSIYNSFPRLNIQARRKLACRQFFREARRKPARPRPVYRPLIRPPVTRYLFPPFALDRFASSAVSFVAALSPTGAANLWRGSIMLAARARGTLRRNFASIRAGKPCTVTWKLLITWLNIVYSPLRIPAV